MKYPPTNLINMDDIIIDDDFLSTIKHNNDSIKNSTNTQKIVTKKDYSQKIKERKKKEDIEKSLNSEYSADNYLSTIAQTNASVGYDGKRKYYPKPEPPMEMDRGRRVRYTPRQDTATVENNDTTRVDTTTVKQDTASINNDTIPAKANTIPPVEESTTDFTVPHRNTAYDLERIINSPYAFENITDNSQAYVNVPEGYRTTRKNIGSNNEERQSIKKGSTLEGLKAFLVKPEGMTDEEHDRFRTAFIMAGIDKGKEIYENLLLKKQNARQNINDYFYRTLDPANYYGDVLENNLTEKVVPMLNQDVLDWDRQTRDAEAREEESQRIIDWIESKYQKPVSVGGGHVRGILTPGHAERFFSSKQGNEQADIDLFGQWMTTPLVKLNENTKDKDIPDNHFLPNTSHHVFGKPRYITFTDDGRFLSTDTIPTSERGFIGTSHGPRGNIATLKGEKIVISSKSGEGNGFLFPFATRNRGNNYIKFKLPNGQDYWVWPYGQDSKEYVNFINELGTMVEEMDFTNFDANSAGSSYIHNRHRIDPKFYGNREFDSGRVKVKRTGGRKSLETL